MLEWKRERNGSTVLLLKGARRVGKSTVAKAFAENEYKSYILIDFVQASKEVKQLFDNLMDLNYIFLRLQSTMPLHTPFSAQSGIDYKTLNEQ